MGNAFAPPPFKARLPWLTGDLQTIANRLVRSPPISPFDSTRIILPMPDGSGDTLLAALDTPTRDEGKPLLVLVHGLTGGEESGYMRSTAAHFLRQGHRVLRLNLRGAGPSRSVCRGQYYAGRSQDLRDVLQVMDPGLRSNGLIAVGYSLGGATLLKYLGEEGSAAPLLAAATISAPLDLSATCAHMLRPRNRLYHHYILSAMKREATDEGAALAESERRAIWSSRTVWEYDDRFIAPRHGFDGAEDYYRRNSAVRFLEGVRVPTLVLSAVDDPWIPIDSYRRFDWRSNAALTPLLPRGGGHVGFFGTDRSAKWNDIVLERFFAASVAQRSFASSFAASTAP